MDWCNAALSDNSLAPKGPLPRRKSSYTVRYPTIIPSRKWQFSLGNVLQPLTENPKLPSLFANAVAESDEDARSKRLAVTSERKKEKIKHLKLNDVIQMNSEKERELFLHYKTNSFYSLHMLLRYYSDQLSPSFRVTNDRPDEVCSSVKVKESPKKMMLPAPMPIRKSKFVTKRMSILEEY